MKCYHYVECNSTTDNGIMQILFAKHGPVLLNIVTMVQF